MVGGGCRLVVGVVGVGGGGGAGVGGGVGLVVVSCGVVGGGTMLKVVVGGGTFLVVSLVMVVLVVFLVVLVVILVAVAACLAGVFTLLFNSLFILFFGFSTLLQLFPLFTFSFSNLLFNLLNFDIKSSFSVSIFFLGGVAGFWGILWVRVS